MPVEMQNKRVVIEGVEPEIDDGRYPIKRTVGERVVVEADVFTDGHEAVSCELRYRQASGDWINVPFEALVNDRWRAQFHVTHIGRYEYTIRGWLDHFKHWSRSLVKRLEANQDVSDDLIIGTEYIEDALTRAEGADRDRLQSFLETIRAGGTVGVMAALSEELAGLMYRFADRDSGTTYDRVLGVTVDPIRARYSAWYEFFPRSCWEEDCTHGTFAHCEQRLPYIAGLGFDVIYLPPIHPIGNTKRKGKNNNVVAQPDEVGSPWAIGSEEGGHKEINPLLGTLDDFKRFLQKANGYGIEIALDIAFQCSPDHPYVKEHPEWFKKRPDGTIQYAENPPKKYEDIYPFDFETPQWRELWAELRSVIEYWVRQGVKIFRVDNPHTKSLRFWDWCINSLKEEYPELIFLAEAFTRPKVMYFLAKIGFTQSYNYFPWRNTRHELTEYLTELTTTDVKEFFRPNLWPNTPDILPEILQVGGRPAFISRFVLAATLGASYGIYGPAYELAVNTPMAPGKEEYLDSEKYEIKRWHVNDPDSLAPLISRVNQIRRENPALHSNEHLRFHPTSNDRLIAYTKSNDTMSNLLLMVVNIDPAWTQSGQVEMPLEELGIDPQHPFEVHELLTDTRYLWSGRRNYVELNPHTVPAQIFRLRRHVRTEQDFDYYL
ncbi:MAG: alpha-1,4-glucan--maltose-1-phosphate maltosyltransferase [Chloroflexia bacterium]